MYPPYKNIKNYFLLIIFTSSVIIAQSDNVKSLTDKAVSDYEKGNYSTAVGNMERALDIMKDKQGNEYNKLLPQTLPGWTRGKYSSRPFDPTGKDGGHFIEQTYNKGIGYVTAVIILDAPMINDVKSLLNTDKTNLSRTGYSLESISNKRSLVRYYEEQKQGEITILANNKTVAAVYGKDVTLREMKNYARLFKFSEINKVK